MIDDSYSAVQLSTLIKQKKISPVEITTFFIKRIEKYNPTLNALLYFDPEKALIQAREQESLIMSEKSNHPLLGLPMTIPDTFDLQGAPTTFGSLLLKDAIAQEDAFEVQQLKKAGAVILGKTNVAEFGISIHTENKLCPRTVNPWNKAFSPGGPNAGVAAAIAAGLTPLALGNDFAGSIRLVSSFCGVAALSPTRGKIPLIRKHSLPFSEQFFFRKGLVSRHIEDLALLVGVLIKAEILEKKTNKDFIKALNLPQPPLKIGWCPRFDFVNLNPEVFKITKEAVEAFKDLGHEVTEFEVPVNQDFFVHFRQILAADRYAIIMPLKEDHPNFQQEISEEAKKWLRLGNSVTGVQYSMAYTYLSWMIEQSEKWFKKYDILLTPTVPIPPFSFNESPSCCKDSNVDPFLGLLSYTLPFNLSGNPCLSLPCGYTSNGLPIGLQMVARPYQDETLLRVAKAFEKMHPWSKFESFNFK